MDWQTLAKKIRNEGDLHIFCYKGMLCLIKRIIDGANSLDEKKNYEDIKEGGRFHLCGYVGIPEGHLLYDVADYYELPINVHGGLTHFGYFYKAHKDLPRNIRWLGFDCGHGFDLAMKYKGLNRRGETYKTLKFVIKQVKSMVDQLTDEGFEVKWKTKNL